MTTLTLYTDFVCPFCFIAERTSVERLHKEYDIEIDWRGYELHPETPAGGMPLTNLLPAARLPAIRDHLLSFARSFGITDMQQQPHVSNTRRVIALAEYGRDQGKLDEVRRIGMDAYWRNGKDLEDDAVLREIATAAGLDAEAALAATKDAKYLGRIDARRKEAAKLGVTGIPTFVIGDQGVVGCQPYEVLEEFVVEAGGAKKRARSG